MYNTERIALSINGIPYLNNGNLKSFRATAMTNGSFVNGMTTNGDMTSIIRGNYGYTLEIDEFIPNDQQPFDWVGFNFQSNQVQITTASCSNIYLGQFNGPGWTYSGVGPGDSEVISYPEAGNPATRTINLRATSRLPLS